MVATNWQGMKSAWLWVGRFLFLSEEDFFLDHTSWLPATPGQLFDELAGWNSPYSKTCGIEMVEGPFRLKT